MKPFLTIVFVFVAFPMYAYSARVDDSLSAYPFEREAVAKGLVDVQTLDSTIRVELKYASTENFMRANVYGDLKRCYLQRKAAEKLVLANRYLKEHRPDCRLLVVDGLRPRLVQKKMWEIVRNTPMQRYVADPRHGSMHNYGCAVDVTIADSRGVRLDMGTPMDHFGELAQPRLEKTLLLKGKLTTEHIANRLLLREVMVKAGFHPLPIEWWHFDAFKKDSVRAVYAIIE